MEDFEKQLKQAFFKEAELGTPECIPLNTLGMYIENKLSGEEASKIQQHIGSCAHCMKRLVELRDTLSIVRKAESGLEKD
ncbi:MAG: zf-HC2 domain-containing protein, partial [Deltaproteobacteria bacterium]|nr:zf-HC2 domain-containing protein [Deltaproteobacteria bacterium]